jgi:hypothetical protein
MLCDILFRLCHPIQAMPRPYLPVSNNFKYQICAISTVAGTIIVNAFA